MADPAMYMGARLHFQLDLALVKIQDSKRSQVHTEQYTEPTIFVSIFSNGLYEQILSEDEVEFKCQYLKRTPVQHNR